jgi:hypothetical protein
MRGTLRLSVFFLSVSCTTWAQNAATDSSSPTTSPVNVSIVPASIPQLASCAYEGTENPIVVRMRNDGTKPIRDLVVALFIPDPKGSGVRHFWTIEDGANPLNPNDRVLTSGAEWERRLCRLAPGIDPSSFSVKVDFVGFEDGSTWGPMELRVSHTVLGAFEGTNYFLGQTDVAKRLAPVPLDVDSTTTEVSDPTTLGPLKLTPILRHSNSGQDRVIMQVTNVSGSLVRGYDFRISFFDHATGTFLKSVSTQTLEMSDDPSTYLAPGQSWGAPPRKVPLSSDGAPAVYKMNLGIVIFEKDAPYRPLTSSRKSDELLAIVQGFRNLKDRQAAQRRAQGLP